MKRRNFLGQFGAGSLLRAAVPGWNGRPWIAANAAPPQDAVAPAEREFFYRPVGAWAADFIPFYDAGRFHLFYLHDWRDIAGHGEGTPWYQISTTDFVHFTEHGQMLPRGTQAEQDLYVFTGSVIRGEGRYHIYYTGHNPYFSKQGKPAEGIMHAASDDLLHWTKVPGDVLFAPQAGFEPNDWRDAFVFWNDQAKEYWMLLAARQLAGPQRRRGCTALAVSRDLGKWEVREPFWTPHLYYTHECPDLFQWGDWWYLLYSEFTERVQTHYRMSRSLRGPWLGPDNDTFDGRAFYAAKTASDGHRRFVFGWVPTRDESKDFKGWNWGGNLMVHELVQEADGTLSVKVPASVDQALGRELAYEFAAGLGPCKIEAGQVELAAPGSFGCAAAGNLPSRCKIETTVHFEPNTRGCGVMLHSSDDFNTAYYVRLEPARNRLVLDSWGRPGDVPYWIELERPLQLDARRPVELKVILDGTVCVVYAANRIAMSTRLYNLKQGSWGVFVKEGVARFEKVRISG